jgi:hypothetical protein
MKKEHFGLALAIAMLTIAVSTGQTSSNAIQMSSVTSYANDPQLDQPLTKGSAQFFIYVYSKTGGLAPGALVRMSKYVNGKWMDAGSGYTGGNGILSKWLDGGYRYQITAQKSGQNGMWDGVVDRSRGNKIKINMR